VPYRKPAIFHCRDAVFPYRQDSTVARFSASHAVSLAIIQGIILYCGNAGLSRSDTRKEWVTQDLSSFSDSLFPSRKFDRPNSHFVELHDHPPPDWESFG